MFWVIIVSYQMSDGVVSASDPAAPQLPGVSPPTVETQIPRTDSSSRSEPYDTAFPGSVVPLSPVRRVLRKLAKQHPLAYFALVIAMAAVSSLYLLYTKK